MITYRTYAQPNKLTKEVKEIVYKTFNN